MKLSLERLSQPFAQAKDPDRRTLVKRPYHKYGDVGWMVRGTMLANRAMRSTPDTDANPFASSLCLYEDGRPLMRGHQKHWAVGKGGGGRYSHWNGNLFFSATDNTDPNTNGREYSFDFSLDQASWERARIAHSSERWNLHPRAEFFIDRGGDVVPPPLTCSIGLTNKCNLRCEICGSQKFLDETGVRRRHMPLQTFEAVAETIFPFLSVVELNSQGDPLLHPQIERVIERIAGFGCEIKVQHNGTLLSDSLVDLLLQQYGTIMLSLDAVGPKFDEVRRGGVWEKAYPGLKRLLTERDPKRLAVGVYPTLTERTIGEALSIADWCADHDADEVVFHRYVPIQNSWEKAPSEDAYRSTVERLRRWCADRNDAVRVLFESQVLNGVEPTDRRVERLNWAKALATADFQFPSFPTSLDGQDGDPLATCTAPRDYIEIGLEGQISACCRAQDVAFGHATSVERFADAWLGKNYDDLRRSLSRGARGPFPLPNCASCVAFYAPEESRDRMPVDYAGQAAGDGLSFTIDEELRLEPIQKENGFCHIAALPPGLESADLELWEDELLLGPMGSMHQDIRELGKGRCVVSATKLYFSTSDGTDARRNQRIYSLRPRPQERVLAEVVETEVGAASKENGLCCVGLIRPGVDMSGADLWEDDLLLGPAGAMHDDIRTRGGGRFNLDQGRVYFSSSDGSDARMNGRRYVLRRTIASQTAGG